MSGSMDREKIDTITKKISLVKMVLQRYQIIAMKTPIEMKPDAIFTAYTGQTYSCTNKKKKRRPITFSQLIHYRDHHPLIESNISASEIRRRLKKIYLMDRNIPKVEDLKFHESTKPNDGCSKQKPPFKFLSLPGISKGIIVEDPVYVFQRILFLKMMVEVRCENCHVVYVHKIKDFSTKVSKNKPMETTETSKMGDHLFVALSMQVGLLAAFFYQDDSQTRQWLSNILSPINEPCVVVMEAEQNEKPTLTSTKAEMSNWLTANDIPHDPKAHRGELLDLIKLTMTRGISSQTDEVIRALGHRALRYPDDVEQLNLLRDNYLNIANKVNLYHDKCSKELMLDCIKAVELNAWQEFEKHVMIDAEWLLLQEDMMMEKIVDGLCMMAADGMDESLADQLIDITDWNTIASEFVI